jgi:hypothetical protein
MQQSFYGLAPRSVGTIVTVSRMYERGVGQMEALTNTTVYSHCCPDGLNGIYRLDKDCK